MPKDHRCARPGCQVEVPGYLLAWAAVAIADDRARLLVDAIAQMCRDCEPEGLCRTPACPLRDYSPLPLADRPDAELVTQTARRKRSWTQERRVRQTASLHRRWAQPGAREQQGERSAARWAAMSEEERREFGEAISVARRTVPA